MFSSLKKKWKVNEWQLTLILCTFALGGSLTGYVGKKIMNLLSLEQDWLWTLVYILLITLIWPMAVTLLSIPFGQFKFFKKYIGKLLARIGLLKLSNPILPKKHLAIFASGTGSNAQKIIDHFRDHPFIRIVLIVCNKPGAGVLNIAIKEGIPTLIIEKHRFFEGDAYLPEMEDAAIDLIVLAGFLWKVPSALVQKFSGRIINIHPALLPDFGGKGMYGANVHRAVLAAGKKESGISIHLVDELYDNGRILFQARCPVHADDTVESLSTRIHELEHAHFARAIEKQIMNE
jgi:formyltetrahydrofolate-dependent phosphoribosylglycinamide formyltransferase